MLTRQQVKHTLKIRGHSYRSAAEALGRNYRHIAGVLSGERTSSVVLLELASLPPRAAIPKNSVYRNRRSAL